MRNYRGSTGAAWLPGVLLGLLALIIALTGSAYAAGQINGAEIAEHSLPADRLVNHSITSTQLAPLNFQPLHLVHFWHSAQALHDTGNPMVAKDDQGIVHLAEPCGSINPPIGRSCYRWVTGPATFSSSRSPGTSGISPGC
jgi:hypothetical protein